MHSQYIPQLIWTILLLHFRYQPYLIKIILA
ncbi:hypothetical protein [Campylobacter phage CAM-P21]|nr:hypothetical protein [Campylobacter phage CAM-P21]